MSPEIKVPSYWLKGVVKFTDTAVWRDGTRPLDVPEFRTDSTTDTLLSVRGGNETMITFARCKSVFRNHRRR
ncbi:hypothetical protein ALC62_14991 [Cyphomyrmex costatus]|uniref:Uncharacterized protein n=1 Tax=Cyphomyrmex costatus TaxID=456900 RepID=A0A151I8A5_9HYME|nr:hypothetical protein ALC62_14991 [Cyphomyrmex costatus]